MRREALKFIVSVSKDAAAKAEAKVSHAQPAEGRESERCYTTVRSAMQERRTITLLRCKHNTRTFNNPTKRDYSANVKCRQCRIYLYTYSRRHKKVSVPFAFRLRSICVGFALGNRAACVGFA